MFVLTRNVSATNKVIATLLVTAVVLWTLGYHMTAQAANITDVKDTLTDSAPGADSDHEIVFVTPTGVGASQFIEVTFPAGFDLSTIGEEDLDLLEDGADEDITGGVQWNVSTTSNTIRFTSGGTATIGAGASTTILIGLNATNSGIPDSQIGNPPTPQGGNESFEIDISAGTSDSGHTRVVILETVEVTATVETIFDFTVYDNGTGESVNGTTTSITTSSTTIPFGILTAYDPMIGSQDLTVQTNAINGFVVTVQSDGAFQSSTGADIDDYKDGGDTIIPETWESPSVGLDIADEDTWGHWGVTSEDATTTRSNEFGSNQWVGVSTTPTILFAHTGPADEVTEGIGSTTVGYKVEISPLQEAGDDYQTTLTYIATPTF